MTDRRVRLESDSDEKRRASRHEMRLAIWFETAGGARVEAVCRNVGLGGMFIETTSPAPYAAPVVIRIRLPGMKTLATLSATVRWTAAEGIGVQFGPMGAQETHALTELIYSG